MIDKPTPTVPLNRGAVVSLIAAILTLFSFCVAVTPIPFTGWACYPSAAILGLVAMVTGIVSLAQIRARNEHGRTYAVIGIWVGGLVLLLCACGTTAAILVLPRVIAFIRHIIN